MPLGLARGPPVALVMCVQTKTFYTHNNNKPWFTPNLWKLRRAMEEAYRSGDRALFKQARNTLEREIRRAKRRYGERLQSRLSANPDPSSVWRGLQNITGNCVEEVYWLFQRQKVRKAPCPDGVSPSCLRACTEQLAPTFSRIFNRSLELCEVPSCFKSSTIIPVPKKPTITGIIDYRPKLLPQSSLFLVVELEEFPVSCDVVVEGGGRTVDVVHHLRRSFSSELVQTEGEMKRIELLVVLLHVYHHVLAVEVFDGEESVKLPCLVNISVSTESTVVWSREDLKYSIVHICHQTGDDLVDQNKRYKNRTWMKMDALQTGDLSLTLRNPTISDGETYTCTVRRFGMELSQINVLLEVKERHPPIWPKVLPAVLVSLVLLASVFGLVFYLQYKRMKHNPDSQVKVDSGVESVQLPCKATIDLPEHAKVEWRDGTSRTVHVYLNSSDQKKEQHWWYRGRTEMKKNLLETGDLSLTLKYPTDRDSCTYTCIVSSKEGDSLMEKQVELTVKGQF
ncbi:uncharacterized protein LOC133420436 [Cololabis saira]|uniref:uncharacterized protein LOC133420436 n=1 Tax=Cololabis saira TaxID=129043 RepID=UPI002AD3C239|nr:uncharacterized protein LOC133420436 [Cololabis saira]